MTASYGGTFMASSSEEKFIQLSAPKSEVNEHANGGDGDARVKSDSRHPSQPLKRASTTPLFSAASSTNTSPKPSREVSPVRLPLKPGSAVASRGSRSRKNSQELSPNRTPASNIPTIPSAAAIQRALSAARVQSPANPEFALDATRLPKPAKSFDAGIGRVKSPPPSAIANKASIYSPRKLEPTSLTPSIVLERPTPVSRSSEELDDEEEDTVATLGIRTPLRGISGTGPTLETVQESSLPATAAVGPSAQAHLAETATSVNLAENLPENAREGAWEKETKTRPESGSESGGNRGANATKGRPDARKSVTASSSVKPQIMHPKKSLTQLHPAKGKTGNEGMVKKMTVETETVSTIPQVALGGGAGERTALGRVETGGSLRLKPSNETIRPKKEKKRSGRKAPPAHSGAGGSISRRFHHHHLFTRPPSHESTVSLSIASPMFTPSFVPNHDFPKHVQQPVRRKHRRAQRRSGDESPLDSDGTLRPSSAALTGFRGRTASSKADIFEAKVASAVDEVNSSDSGETFVYESNPPEPLSGRPYRYHSRTPSTTSTVSQIDHHGLKGRPDGQHSIAGKKSMKFANNSYLAAGHPGEPIDGTVRGPGHSARTSAGNASHQRHIGRYGRGGAGHASLFDTNSPFANATGPMGTAANHVARLSPRTSSSRSAHLLRASVHPKKLSEPLFYDLEGEGADDERTPLVGSIRSGRNRYSRRPTSGALRHSSSAGKKGYHCCSRMTAFAWLGALFTLLIAFLITILVMCSQPLYGVFVNDIRNVLASEQEIMLDLHVHAVNPNLVAIQISDLDVNIFAKSRHVNTHAVWRDGRARAKPNGENQLRETFEAALPPLSRSERNPNPLGGVDEGTDPIDDPVADSQTMLLGRIFEFDTPLIFDPSPIRRNPVSAIGEVRLASPGNRTEAGGSERWEKIILHDFELIVRGMLRYSTPITSRSRSASISGSVRVYPGGDDDRIDSGAASNSPRAKPSIWKFLVRKPWGIKAPKP